MVRADHCPDGRPVQSSLRCFWGRALPLLPLCRGTLPQEALSSGQHFNPGWSQGTIPFQFLQESVHPGKVKQTLPSDLTSSLETVPGRAASACDTDGETEARSGGSLSKIPQWQGMEPRSPEHVPTPWALGFTQRLHGPCSVLGKVASPGAPSCFSAMPGPPNP